MSKDTNKRLFSDRTIIDADIHVSPSKDELLEYVDKRHHHYIKMDGMGRCLLWEPYMGKIEPQAGLEGLRGVQGCLEGLDVLQNKFGIDYPILNVFDKLQILPQTDLAIAQMKAINEIILNEYIPSLPENTHFFGFILPQKPDLAAEEIDKMANEERIVGAFMPNAGLYTPLGDSSYDIIYRAAEDNDLPVVFHGTAGAGGFKTEFPIQNQGLERFLSVHTLSHLWTQTLTLTSLIVQGTPKKFPDLNFAILEAGISWIPYMMFRLNREYKMRRSEAPLLDQLPEEYIRESFYFATQPVGEPMDANHMKDIVNIVGIDNMMFATDYPHWDFDNPEGIERYMVNMFNPNEQKRLFSGTATELFGINP